MTAQKGDRPKGDGSRYADWKRVKIERGLAQAADRDAMIPAEQILEDLKFAR